MGNGVKTGRKNKDYFGYKLLLPSSVLFLLISVYPLVSGIWMSFTNKSLMRSNQTKFIFLENYIKLFQIRSF